MSYCFGCKDSIKQFNAQVVNCEVETQDQITTREANSKLEDGDPNKQIAYRGNVGELNGETCQVGGTNDGEPDRGQWAGLNDHELSAYCAKVNGECTYTGPQAFHPRYWAGIDCSGLVQQALIAAAKTEPGVNLQGKAETALTALGLIGSQTFFKNNEYVFYQEREKDPRKQVDQQKAILGKGDLVRYFDPGKTAHISIFYSDKTDRKGDYQIIHAFGARQSDHDNNFKTPPVFSRKVIITGNKVSPTISNPVGYGRIRLWD